MSDKEFDEFFRKTAENYDIPYNPKAWKKMRLKLDRAGGLTGGTTRRIISSIALLIILGTLTLWYVRSQQSSGQTSASESSYSELKDEKMQAEEEHDKEASQPALSYENQKQEVEINNSNKTIKLSTSAAKGEKESPQPLDKAGNVRSYAVTESTRSQRAPVATWAPETGNDDNIQITFLSSLPWTAFSPLWSQTDLSIKETPISPESPIPSKPDTLSELSRIEPVKPGFYRFGLSFMVSPDLSALHVADISQVGTKSGIGLEFFLFRNLSLQTGAILSHTLYAATGGYEPSPGFWKYRTKPSNIDAECRVLDIPINLRYYAFTWKKSRVFLSGGLSSYLMLKEDYWYDYAIYKPNQYRFHSVQNKNQHYFKVSNFSLGYERALGSHWALQAEPFIKIPLAGVGEGKVKLITTGMFFTVKYQIGLSGLRR